MATKKKKKRGSEKNLTAGLPDKFHGEIKITTPTGGRAVNPNECVVLALRSIEFGNIPDPGNRNELSLSMTVVTDPKNEDPAKPSFRLELLKYVGDNDTLNVKDLVLFSGPVRTHVTLRCSIDELDEKEMQHAKELVTQLLGLAKEFVGEGPKKTLLGGLPLVIGALLSFNQDDQLLVLNHSLYTADVKVDDKTRTLREGRYTFEKIFSESERTKLKIAARNNKPQVKISLDVLTGPATQNGG
jgi:hypothetical protein